MSDTDKVITTEKTEKTGKPTKRKLKTAPNTIEKSYAERGFSPIAGVDEAGRGPLAGPVVVCALILPEGLVIEGVNDSKKVTALRREKLAVAIKEAAISYAFGIVQPEEIDRMNILQATLYAMSTAVAGLSDFGGSKRSRDSENSADTGDSENFENSQDSGTTPVVALIDGTVSPTLPAGIRAVCVEQGDSASHLIAAASILAKVERDNIMQKLHEAYPQYGWDKNKGYGTPAHMDALREHGLSPQHRKSFCRGIKM